MESASAPPSAAATALPGMPRHLSAPLAVHAVNTRVWTIFQNNDPNHIGNDVGDFDGGSGRAQSLLCLSSWEGARERRRG